MQLIIRDLIYRSPLKTKAELLDELAVLVEKPVDEVRDEVAAVKHAFYVIRKQELEKEKQEFLDKGNEEAAFAPMPDEAEARLKELLNTYKERRAEQLAAIEAEQQANLDKKNRFCPNWLKLPAMLTT